MNLLVSAVKPAGGVYSLDTETGVVERVASDDTTGLAWMPDGSLARVLRSEGVVELLDPETWRQRRVIPLPRGADGDYHDLRLQNGVVTAVATMHTALDIFDLEFNRVRTLCFRDGLRDPWHLNSVLLYPTCMLLSVFAVTDEDEGWRGKEKSGKVLCLDALGGQYEACNSLSSPHSLTPVDGGFAVCSSSVSEIHIRRRDSVEQVSVGAGFMRGLHHSGSAWYTSLSTRRHSKNEAQFGRIVEVQDDGLVSREWDMPAPELYDVVGGVA